jgi:hypothetical protein
LLEGVTYFEEIVSRYLNLCTPATKNSRKKKPHS